MFETRNTIGMSILLCFDGYWNSRCCLGKTAYETEPNSSCPVIYLKIISDHPLDVVGIEFIPENGGGPGVRLKK